MRVEVILLDSVPSVVPELYSLFLPNQPFFFFSAFSLLKAPGAPSEPQAFFDPVFLPFLISLLVAQQQHWPSVIRKARIDVAAAIHMNANICVPIAPSMLSCSTDVTAFCMMMKSTVAITVATVVKSAARKVKIVTSRPTQRVYTVISCIGIMTKERQAPAKKRANIQLETRRIRSRMSVTSAGRATGEILLADCCRSDLKKAR
jgi:hypothetical protein